MFQLFRQSYSGLSRDTWILAFVTLVNRSGMMVLPFLTIYLTSAKGFTISQAGIISGFFGLGSLVGSYSGGWLSDRFGYFSVQLMSLVLGGIACISLAWIDHFLPLCVMMFFCSAILDMLRPAMTSAVSSFAGPNNLTRSFSLIRMAINLGAGIGPAIAGIVAGFAFHWIFIGDGLTSIAAGFLLYFYFRHRIRNDHKEKRTVIKSVSPMRNRSFMVYMFFSLMYAVIFFQLFCTLPLYYEHVHHLARRDTGYLIAMNGIIIFLFEMMLVFKLENSVHPRKIIMWGVLLSGLSLVLLNLFSSPWILVISMIILSFSEIFSMPFMMTVAISPAEPSNRGLYTGIYTSVWSAAFIIAPLTGTAIVTHFGYETLWWAMGALSLITMAGIWFVVPKIYKVPAIPVAA